MIGERREVRTKNQAQTFHWKVDAKGHSNLMLCPLVLYIHSFISNYTIYDDTDTYFFGGQWYCGRPKRVGEFAIMTSIFFAYHIHV
mgnify:CR=1 FL=1